MAGTKAAHPAASDNFTESSSYRLAGGVRVRQERFGLLFYNHRGPRIYFVPTGRFINEDFFDGKQTIGKLVDSIRHKSGLPGERILDRLKEIFRTFEAKGLIDEQRLR
ncbi:MAG: hypothetical protein P4L55_05990 [Syntrophobacteraceae bacterium]|nr:hypothetical protein [Syntrophobacteraceae bacterium]